jgi:hypothetical protein
LELPAPLNIIALLTDSVELTVPGLTGGSFDADANEYRLNMTSWVQGIINGTYPNTGLSLQIVNQRTTAYRTPLAGPDNTQAPMKLVLTFTTY